jgi:hypothetical protein
VYARDPISWPRIILLIVNTTVPPHTSSFRDWKHKADHMDDDTGTMGDDVSLIQQELYQCNMEKDLTQEDSFFMAIF